jgi:hypothetical protein
MDSFQEFLTTQSTQIPIFTFVINLLLAAILSFVLGKVYVRYGRSLSNRKEFSNNFITLAMTTALIITVVKSSLALSLGLVGALSIIRFRAAIKEPEELTYLFLVIAIGLGFGASQSLITIIGFLLAIIIIRVVSRAKLSGESKKLFLNIVDNPHTVELSAIVAILKKYCMSITLRRFDESKESFEASFLVEMDNFNRLDQTREELLGLSEAIRVTFLDNRV